MKKPTLWAGFLAVAALPPLAECDAYYVLFAKPQNFGEIFLVRAFATPWHELGFEALLPYIGITEDDGSAEGK